MDVGNYLLGLVLALLALGPLAVAARRLRARLFPGWSGATAHVAEAILFAAPLVLALELAGVIGVFNRVGVVVTCAVTGVTAWAATDTIRSSEPELPSRAPAPIRPSRASRTLAIAAVAVAGAPWLGWVIFAYRHGMETTDTLWYHLPFAARFVQTGSILHLHYVDDTSIIAFYPGNSELFHAFGLVLFGGDLLSPVINLAWAALALTAAWAIGHRWGRGPHCVVAMVLVLATPALVDTQPGGAYNDVACIALLLSAAALLVNSTGRLSASALAAAAAGLALGTKYTMIVPTIALAVGMVAVSRSRTRAREARVWATGLILLGGYWYVRNAVAAGNPVAPLAIHLGPLSLAAPPTSPTYTVVQFVTNSHVWKTYYIPGLRAALGPAWSVIVALGITGAVAAILARCERSYRVLGGVAVVGGLAFLATPQLLGSPPVFFVYNVRYGLTALALGLVLLPIHPRLRRASAGAVWMAVMTATLIVTQIDPGVWPTGIDLKPFSQPIRGGSAVAGAILAAALGVGVLVISLWRPSPRLRKHLIPPRVIGGLALSAALAVVGGGWLVADSYAHRRYRGTNPLPAIYRWAQGVHDARIGVVGFVDQYPLYGGDASNYVQYVGASEPHGGFGAVSTCEAWRSAVDRGRYQWLVLAPTAFPLNVVQKTAPEVAWTESSSAATAVIRERAVSGDLAELFHVSGPLDPKRCARP